MDKYDLYAPQFLPSCEYLSPEKNFACPGCGLSLGIRQIYKAVEQAIEKAKWVSIKDVFKKTLELKSQLSVIELKGKKANSVIVCFDTEAEAERSEILNKELPDIAQNEGFIYIATCCTSYPFDLYIKAKRAIEAQGNAYLHVLCPCPVGWGFDPKLTVKVGRLAVETNLYPLYEIARDFCRISVSISRPRPVEKYLKLQKRFESLNESEIKEIQERVNNSFEQLKTKASVERGDKNDEAKVGI